MTDDAVVVPAALRGERVDRAVALLTGWSRADIQALVLAGAVLVDGRAVAKSHRLREGALVELLAEPRAPVPPGPDPTVALAVVHEDPDVVVVDKPAGVAVHPGAGHPEPTLVHGLLARYPELAEVGEPDRPGIVHRLDRGTSGLLAVARTPVAHRAMVEMLAAHAVERGYLALVRGVPDSPRGLVDAPVGRSPRHRTRMAVRLGGKEARTFYEVREVLPAAGVALLECSLETGRTHQVRVHLAAIGHPVVGDAAYGGHRAQTPGGEGGRAPRDTDGDLALRDRVFLHAHRLGFEHPVSGEPLQFAAGLPPELDALLGRLRRTEPPPPPETGSSWGPS